MSQQVLFYNGSKEENQCGGLPIYARIVNSDGSLDNKKIRHIVRHSPDGFQWGYGGSGPADAALSILTHFVNFDSPQFKEQIETLYQRFKFDFIAQSPNNLYIEREGILKWLQENKK